MKRSLLRVPFVLRVLFVAGFVGVACDAPSQVPQGQSATIDPPLHALFIGNSYTYYNNMPALIAAFAAAAPASQQVQIKDLSRGAASLESLWGSRQRSKPLEVKNGILSFYRSKVNGPSLSRDS